MTEKGQKMKHVLNASVPSAPVTDKEVSARMRAAKARGEEAEGSCTSAAPIDDELSAILKKMEALRSRADDNRMTPLSEGRNEVDDAVSLPKRQISNVAPDLQKTRIEAIVRNSSTKRFFGESGDGKVVATVDGNGRLIRLHIEETIDRSSSRAVEGAVMDAVSAAKTAATEQWLSQVLSISDPR